MALQRTHMTCCTEDRLGVDILFHSLTVIHPIFHFITFLICQEPPATIRVAQQHLSVIKSYPPPWAIWPAIWWRSLCRLEQTEQQDCSLHRLGDEASFFKLHSLCRLKQNHGQQEGQHGENRGGNVLLLYYIGELLLFIIPIPFSMCLLCFACVCVRLCVCVCMLLCVTCWSLTHASP